jgi:hypothetical protein
MLKRDRTGEEKRVDAKIRAGIMKLGPNPDAHEEPNPFPHFLAWDREGRRGQRCKVLRTTPKMAMIEFDDGFQLVVNRLAIRRYG